MVSVVLVKAVFLAITLFAAVNLDDARRACAPDAVRLCSAQIALGRGAIVACLRANEKNLSPECRAFVAPRH